jgi:glucan-binding YG repeat protein
MKNTTYYFDANGTMYTPVPKNGFYFENDAWYYYVDGSKNYAGLIWCDGPEGNDPGYYYVNSQCKLITGCDYWISKNNGLMGNQTYTFDANGTMLQVSDGDSGLLQGIVEENGELYYYEDGIKTYAGLILIDGDYYYVNSKGKVIRDCTYWISKNNGYMKNGNYTFDAEGKMILN